jgi:hypothetical protein
VGHRIFGERPQESLTVNITVDINDCSDSANASGDCECGGDFAGIDLADPGQNYCDFYINRPVLSPTLARIANDSAMKYPSASLI